MFKNHDKSKSKESSYSNEDSPFLSPEDYNN
jgi:hypothetical protein